MKIAFFGTADFSKNILADIISNGNLEVKLVVSQPDKPVWRKKELLATPVKALALENNIEALQPEKLRNNDEFFNKLRSLDLDFIVVVAYGKIVPKEVLEAAKHGCINIHGSILPAYRWASPIQESLKNWDTETWLTIMYMSEWMDEWDILSIQKIDIDIMDKTPDIFRKFEWFWAKLLIKTLKGILAWEIKWVKQDDSKATYCSKIEKSDWEINFEKQNIEEIYNKFRAYYPWPGIYNFYNDKKFSIEDCFYNDIDLSNDEELSIGEVVEIEDEHNPKNKEIWVICKGWILILKQVKLEWKKSMDILSFVNGNKDFLDYKF